MVSDDGFDALCMRVQSSKEIHMRSGEIGYVHNIKEKPKLARPTFGKRRLPEKPSIDANSIYMSRLVSTPKKMLSELAQELSVTTESLESGLGVGAAWFSHEQAWGFPMRDGKHNVIGIRLRNKQGEKWAVKGSRGGLFYSLGDIPPLVVVCEGPTDAAAAISCGLFAIGRPSCSAGVQEIMDFVAGNRTITRVVIIADNDTPGLNGARALSAALQVKNIVLTLPCKDMREFYKRGGNAAMIEFMCNGMVWVNPKLQGRC